MTHNIFNEFIDNELDKSRKKARDRRRYLRRLDMGTLSELLCSLPTVGPWGIPKVAPNNFVNPPERLVPFSKLKREKDLSKVCCHFSEADIRFVQTICYPKDMIELLSECQYVACPDFSQLIGWPKFACFANSCWNKALGSYWQQHNLPVVPNLTWNYSDSFEYSATGWPQGGMVLINSKGCLATDQSAYYWQEGYEYMLNALHPKVILRIGPKMPHEQSAISVYYSEDHIIRMRNGS